MMTSENTIDKIISLCKRRGFVFPGSEIYGGLANSWDYGPLGVELKNNIKKLWWDRFVRRRVDVVGLDAALIMNPRVWEASGHLREFTDPLVECKNCHDRFRADHLIEKLAQEAETQVQTYETITKEENRLEELFKKIPCISCNQTGKFTPPRQFNLMLKTFLGPAEEKANTVYFRPETAQAMFVNFKQVVNTMRVKLPFGIAQTGKAFRNEITPGNFIFRTREFEQMEIEYFIKPPELGDGWEEHFEHWRQEMWAWMTKVLGLKREAIHELEVPEGERAHYSKRTIDFEYDFPFGRKELYGLAYRTDFDLKNHETSSGENLKYKDEDGKEYWPHVIEPTWGVDRSVLAVLCGAYTQEAERVVLKLKPSLAPYKAAVFPLLSNKPHLVERAQEIFKDLQKHFYVAWDDRGNIGKRYFAQDEIGTPFCITVDFDTVGDGNDAALKDTVTVRDRDTMKQERLPVARLLDFLKEKIASE